MDTHHLYLLERIREAQLLSAEVERRNAERLKVIIKLLKESKSTPPTKSPSNLNDWTKYTFGAIIITSVLSGWDLATAVEKLTPLVVALAKLRGGP